MMLREDWEIALDEVIVACEAAADGHADAADHLKDHELAASLWALARRRQDAAARLEEVLRSFGRLPRTPDRDTETVRHLLTRIRETLSQDVIHTVLDERERAEEQLLHKLEAALARNDLPQAAVSLLHELRHDAMAAREELGTMQITHKGENQ